MAIANNPRLAAAASNAQDFSKSRALQPKAHAVIPGGAHTYAKGDDQYPEQAPAFIVRGKGCHVWDVDGNEFIEYGMGLRAVTLGHAFEPVVKAAYEQMQLGANFTRPAKIEVDAAEALLGDRRWRRNGEIRQERLRCDDRCGQTGSCLHGTGPGGYLRRPTVFLNGRLVHRNHRDQRGNSQKPRHS